MLNRKTLVDIDPWLTPYADSIQGWSDYIAKRKDDILNGQSIADFALGHLYFGLHRDHKGWVFREWAPNATRVYLVGEFNDWQELPEYELQRKDNGVYEIHLPLTKLSHLDRFKLHVYWAGGSGYRLPSYANRVVQDSETNGFDAQVWYPEEPFAWQNVDFKPEHASPIIYEAHIGMSGEDESVASYEYFTSNILPRIKKAGYNTVQLMAIQEHPYYGSFGYHVSNFFAASSRFGTPDQLKELVDTAHGMGLAVILDIVHSHAVKNENEGLARFDGTSTQYFHAGERGNHSAWDSKCFDYGKHEVNHFLLSNCRFWLDEYKFDGFRFDGVTSMIYKHHGLGKAFTSYDDYFNSDIDMDALAYLTMANELIHELRPKAITIAEEVSALPGLAANQKVGGVGFDYRMSMGVPDLWIKTLKEKRDEDWALEGLFHELTTRRPEERVISYAESHDQALVGDKTLIFRLIDQDMYWHMQIDDNSLVVERGVALHKMIRLLTAATNGGGYLNFMGNEFGHPEWIDFPREGNGWSYKYARRQWSLADDPSLKYRWLGDFDQAMIEVVKDLGETDFQPVSIHEANQVLSFMRSGYLFVFNFSPNSSHTDYSLPAKSGRYRVALNSDSSEYGGHNRVDDTIEYRAVASSLSLYLPTRTALVLRLRD